MRVLPFAAPSAGTDAHGTCGAGLTPVSAADIVRFFEQLQASDLAHLARHYTPAVAFKDPFNEVQGVQALADIFAHMFKTLDEPRFIVTQVVEQGDHLFLAWDFRFCMRRWRSAEQCIRGGSLLQRAADGRISVHRDYWDAAEELYEKLPLLGGLMRWLKRHAAS